MTVTLEIHSPRGRLSTVELDGRPVTIGRPTPEYEPDVPLDDPLRWVSRQHCVLEAAGSAWYLTDRGTENGTLLRRDDGTEQVEGRVPLPGDEVVLIPGDQTEDGLLLYWQLRLVAHSESGDAYSTEPAMRQVSGDCVEYEFAQARLFHHADDQRIEIDLTANEHKLIRYMADRNRRGGGVAVACDKDELCSAVWGDSAGGIPFGVDEQNLRDLVGELRKKLQPRPENIIQTVTGFGYRLRTCGWGPRDHQE